MYWQKRFDREDPDADLLRKIQDIREEHKDYGYRRIHGELRKQGIKVNKKRVHRIVQKYGMQVTSFTRKSRRFSTYKGVVGRIAPNRVNRRFNTSVPHQKKILSYGISDRPSAQSIMTALNEAIDVTNDCKFRRTFHSDRGWAYQMGVYRNTLSKHRIFQSMSRKGNCYDNSPMENFFGIMKQEMYYGQVYSSFDELKDAIDKYIRYYNQKRGKASLGYRSPIEYREEMLAA